MLIDAVTESYNKFFFEDVGREIYDFFWGDFADWYVELTDTTVKCAIGLGNGNIGMTGLSLLADDIVSEQLTR
ncbi:hypothetical protein V6Z11_D06G155200 [Gossypium hirsutum]